MSISSTSSAISSNPRTACNHEPTPLLQSPPPWPPHSIATPSAKIKSIPSLYYSLSLSLSLSTCLVVWIWWNSWISMPHLVTVLSQRLHTSWSFFSSWILTWNSVLTWKHCAKFSLILALYIICILTGWHFPELKFQAFSSSSWTSRFQPWLCCPNRQHSSWYICGKCTSKISEDAVTKIFASLSSSSKCLIFSWVSGFKKERETEREREGAAC